MALDGISWQVVRPLVDSGEMPHLARLVREGAAGQLETVRPTWTPVLFTTMATGKLPEEHGINTFVSSEGIPLISNLRQVPALWNILSSRGLPSLFYSWPVTWPAEALRSRVLNRLDTAGCRFHPDDVYLYFVHDEASPGVVVIRGGDLEGGQAVNGMSVEDVAPTVLALLGLPAAEHMVGRTAGIRLEPDAHGGPRRLTAEMIPTYGTTPATTVTGEAISSAEDQTIREDLQALGYIE